MAINLPNFIEDRRMDPPQGVVGDSWNWYATEPTAAKNLHKPDSMMSLKSMVSAMTDSTKRNQIIKFIVGLPLVVFMTYTRTVNMMDSKIVNGITKRTLKAVSLKNSQSSAIISLLISSLSLSQFHQFRGVKFSIGKLFSSVSLKCFGSQITTPSLSIHPVVFFSGFWNARIAKLLSGRTWLINRLTPSTDFFSIVFHNIRIPFYGGLR